MTIENHVWYKAVLGVGHFPRLKYFRDDTLAALRTSEFVALFEMTDNFYFNADIQLVLLVLVLNYLFDEAGFIV